MSIRFVQTFLLAFVLSGATPVLAGSSPEIELYTMGTGDDLFTKFGHAALCVVSDRLPGGGLCYNYGTSDFSRPVGLGWEVVRGRALFWVSVSDLPGMIAAFASEDRTIYRQPLPLNEAQGKEMARALARDALPENRVYVYNHFLENCSTRPRDHIDGVTEGALRRVRLPDIGTYRDYALRGFAAQSRALVPAGNFLMGRWVDRDLDAFEAMFIPDVLREGVQSALGVEPEIVYSRVGPLPSELVQEAWVVTWFVFLLIVLAFGIWALRTRGRLPRVSGAILLGGLGSVLLFAALVSVLPELRRNELLLVFFPLDFALASGNRAFVASYATMRLTVLLLVAVLAAVGVFIQPLWPFWLLAAGIVAAVRISVYERA